MKISWLKLASLLVLCLGLLLPACSKEEDDEVVDTTPPAAIVDLAATPGAVQGRVDLTWTAVGDDGQNGSASSYLVKYGVVAIDEATFDSSATFIQSWTPAQAGTLESYFLTSLSGGQTYYFAIKAIDDEGQLSPLSNVPSVTLPDVTPPQPISDLSAVPGPTPGTIDLAWTAVGDDGTLGTATLYILKYSTSLITVGNFDSATTYAQAWTPLPTGQLESKTLLGFTEGVYYYFALKAEDDVPNTSGISNVVVGTPPDTVAPAAVTDLAASPGSLAGTVDLTWTASGDDGSTGTAASYHVVYSSAPITEGNYGSAMAYNQSWTPILAGSTENHTITGLTPGATVYFAIRVLDETPNASPASNSPSAVVTLPDTTAPSAVTDLAASTGTVGGSVQLTWTSPGDDGTTGTAQGYEIRYSTQSISAATYAQAVIFPQTLIPQIAGSTENLTVTGLAPGTTYFFALKTSDESSNVSAVSNSPSAQAAAGLDIWATVAPTQVPSPRSSHTAINCGSEVILWGGLDAANVYYDDGYRFDPATQKWLAIANTGSPVPRANHQGVWTGTEMIVWGGDNGNTALSFKNTGGRYSPTLDQWSSMSTVNAPSGRRFHTVVWTGSEMIVWGGANGANASTYLSSGARYNPATDTWTPLPVAGAPSARTFHAAVWSGSEMIIWGGESTTAYLSDGARYNPATNTWSSMASPSVSVLPVPNRSRHVGVWTGSTMLIWGGVGVNITSQICSDGATYNPATNTWTSISSTGAPAARYFPEGAWTGTDLVVWGGLDATSTLINTGGVYNLSGNSWTAMPTQGAPSGRWWPSSTWTGTELMIWGGFDSQRFFSDGALYDPSLNTWSPTLALSARSLVSSTLAGTEAFFWGGFDGTTYLDTGGLYDPALDRWTPATLENAPTARAYATAVWTGTLVMVWGGYDGIQAEVSGGRYTPSTDTWTSVNNAPVGGAPLPRYAHTATWTGTSVIIWGGTNGSVQMANGESYNVGSDSWTTIATGNEPSARSGHTAVLAGTEIIVWGGHDGTNFVDTGARYNVSGNTWTVLPAPPAGHARSNHSVVWTGTDMIIWGGANAAGALRTGLVYNLAGNSWSTMSTTSAPSARYYHSAAWTAAGMFIWGGGSGSGIYNDGFFYDPTLNTWTASAATNPPGARYQHASVWTGSSLVVWGGNDGTNYLRDGGIYFP